MVTANAGQNLLSGIGFERISSSVRDENGSRYLSVTFGITNSSGSDLSNLSLYALSQPASIGGTAMKELLDAVNTPLTLDSSARNILPTHRMASPAGVVIVPEEADFQAYTPSEAAALQAHVDALMPDYHVLEYGYVARNAAGRRAIANGDTG